MNIKELEYFWMSNSTYLYFFTSFIAVSSLVYFFFNFKPNKSHINNKILLKNLLESLDLELPEELKRIDSSSTDPQWLHIGLYRLFIYV